MNFTQHTAYIGIVFQRIDGINPVKRRRFKRHYLTITLNHLALATQTIQLNQMICLLDFVGSQGDPGDVGAGMTRHMSQHPANATADIEHTVVRL